MATIPTLPVISPEKIRFPAFRRFNDARTEANNSMVGLLVGTRLSNHLLQSHAGSPVLLPNIYPAVVGVDLLNRTVVDAQHQLDECEAHLAMMALPYLQAVFEYFAASSAELLALQGFKKSQGENGQGLRGTFDFIERASQSSFSPLHLTLFNFVRQIRNAIIHHGSASGSKLDNSWVNLSSAAKKRWTEITKREYLVGGDKYGRIRIEAQELIAALAITKRMASEVCGHLLKVLSEDDWASIVFDDYAQNVRPPTRRSTLERELCSWGRREYGPAAPSKHAIHQVVVSKQLHQ